MAIRNKNLIKYNKMRNMLLLACLSIMACSKYDVDEGIPSLYVERTEECPNVQTLSGWNFDIGQGLTLRHTEGLRSMALSGSHGRLDQEFCGIAESARIPSGLEDDPEQDGYATQAKYGDYIIAMYHPSTFPDHFITYNTIDGSWIRWELGDRPTIFRQS